MLRRHDGPGRISSNQSEAEQWCADLCIVLLSAPAPLGETQMTRVGSEEASGSSDVLLEVELVSDDGETIAAAVAVDGGIGTSLLSNFACSACACKPPCFCVEGHPFATATASC